ncbi:DUF268 domain-containing protein [Candidatus Parcubacteria bacterium]|nr:DUF268 domain-containing protein [Candidatus Parcubacteria bacterium]
MQSQNIITRFKNAYHRFTHKTDYDWYADDLKKFVQLGKQVDGKRFDFENIGIFPFRDDRTSNTAFDTHYIYHPAWAARVLSKLKPTKHVDISSTLHFCSIVSAFVPVEFYDYRPALLQLSQLHSQSADLTKLLFKDDELESVSCMHTVEHIGLGRYGDPLDPLGDVKAMKELQRVVKKGGSLLFVTPVGRPKIAFNGHRIYSFEMIIESFDTLELKEFSLIPDNAMEIGMINDCDPSIVKEQEYGCGCFWFRKRD